MTIPNLTKSIEDYGNIKIDEEYEKEEDCYYDPNIVYPSGCIFKSNGKYYETLAMVYPPHKFTTDNLKEIPKPERPVRKCLITPLFP